MGLPDLNQLRTFIALYETRSATIAADQLGVTQPTVSYTLRSLRRRLDDDLFRRDGYEFVPTPKATRLYEPLKESLQHIDHVLTEQTDFDPSTYRGTITFSLSTMGVLTFLPAIAAATRREAPHVHLEVVPHVAADAEDSLLRGQVDLALSVRPLPHERLWRTPFKPVEYVAITSEDHPLPRTSERMFDGRSFVKTSSRGGHTYPNDALAEHGLTGQIALSIADYSSLPGVVEQSDLVALLPVHVAEFLQQRYRLVYQQLPWPVPSPPVSVYSRPAESLSPVQRWFRELALRASAPREHAGGGENA